MASTNRVFPTWIGRLILLIGISISFLAVLAMPELFHRYDILVYTQWAECWANNWRDIYRLCGTTNYPILGSLTTAGLMNLVMTKNFDQSAVSFRLALAVFDGLNVLGLYWIARRLRIEQAAYWAGIIGVSLSSWVGGALWGQIDNVGLGFILLAIISIISANQTAQKSRRIFWLVGGAFWLACSMLTKQLTIFSFAPLLLMLLISACFAERRPHMLLYEIGIVLVTLLFGLFGWDLIFHLPYGYLSNLQYVWSKGNGAMDAISMNGFNLWIFLKRDPWNPTALVPIFATERARTLMEWLCTPYGLGNLAFLGVNLVAGFQLLRLCLRRYVRGHRSLDSELIGWWLFFAALVNLSFNVLLTGTHERYLYYFYPMAFLACLELRQVHPRLFSFRTILILLTGSLSYGLFVLGILSRWVYQYGDASHKIMSLFHAGLLVYWVILMIRGTVRKNLPGTAP